MKNIYALWMSEDKKCTSIAHDKNSQYPVIVPNNWEFNQSLGLLLIAGIISGCSTALVRSDSDREIDFAGHKIEEVSGSGNDLSGSSGLKKRDLTRLQTTETTATKSNAIPQACPGAHRAAGQVRDNQKNFKKCLEWIATAQWRTKRGN